MREGYCVDGATPCEAEAPQLRIGFTLDYQELNATACEPQCLAGSYINDQGECLTCPQGYSTAGTDEYVCDNCAPGYGFDADAEAAGQDFCIQCEGFYSKKSWYQSRCMFKLFFRRMQTLIQISIVCHVLWDLSRSAPSDLIILW